MGAVQPELILMIYTLLILIAFAPDTFTGKVTAVTDGDSIKVLRDKTEVTIRLEGIDCPELGQAYGRQAKNKTSELCFGKVVAIEPQGKDRYGRTLAEVILTDGTSLNQELVRQGYAWWFHKYSDDQTLKQLEAEAKAKKLGLWTDAKPVAPWDWRDRKRTLEHVPNLKEIVPNGVSVVAVLPNPAGEDAGHEKVTINNSTKTVVDLDGWKLIDKAGNAFLLSGKIEAGKSLEITMTEATMPLNNNGDTVLLIDGDGTGRSRVSYDKSHVQSGLVIRFAK